MSDRYEFLVETRKTHYREIGHSCRHREAFGERGPQHIGCGVLTDNREWRSKYLHDHTDAEQ